MGQVYDIPFSALVATLLLKNRVVRFDDINNFENIVVSWGYNYSVVDDIYVSNLSYDLDDFLSLFLSRGDDYLSIRDDLDYNSKIGNLTIRQILEEVASYPGDMLLNYVGYRVIENNKNDFNSGQLGGKVLVRAMRKFSAFCFKSI